MIQCDGLAVAPGFIDSHSHSDLQVLENRREKVAQGVTAEVVGNCGFSTYPASANLKLLRDFANGIFCGNQDWGWPTARAYLDRAERSAATTVFSLVGHGTLRIACAGNRLGPLAERDLDWMEQMVSESLQQGACGLSTGLMYAPGGAAPFKELERLCQVVARHGKVYATHMRDYGDHLAEAVDEQLELAMHLRSSLTRSSHHRGLGHLHVVEAHDIEAPGQIDGLHRRHGETGRRRPHEDLRHAGAALVPTGHEQVIRLPG